MRVRAGVMNAFGCAYEGTVHVSRVLRLVRAFMKRGADEICLADSSGLANPLQMENVLARVRGETGEMELSLHLHNTRGLGLANVFSALRQGLRSSIPRWEALGAVLSFRVPGATSPRKTRSSCSMR